MLVLSLNIVRNKKTSNLLKLESIKQMNQFTRSLGTNFALSAMVLFTPVASIATPISISSNNSNLAVNLETQIERDKALKFCF